MSESSRSMDVLKKILQRKTKMDPIISDPLKEQVQDCSLEDQVDRVKKQSKRPGRPFVPKDKKAKNFTLCMGQKYLKFLDDFRTPQNKLMGRGRKVKFIIDEYIVLYKRQKSQIDVLNEVLQRVDETLSKYSVKVKKGEKLQLTNGEKSEISRYVNQVQILIKVLGFTPRELYRLLTRERWATMSFCLDWKKTL